MKTFEELVTWPRQELMELVATLKGLRDNFTHDCVELWGESDPQLGLKMAAYDKRLREQLKLAQKALSRKFKKRKAAPLEPSGTAAYDTERITIAAARRLCHKECVGFRPGNQEWAVRRKG